MLGKSCWHYQWIGVCALAWTGGFFASIRHSDGRHPKGHVRPSFQRSPLASRETPPGVPLLRARFILLEEGRKNETKETTNSGPSRPRDSTPPPTPRLVSSTAPFRMRGNIIFYSRILTRPRLQATSRCQGQLAHVDTLLNSLRAAPRGREHLSRIGGVNRRKHQYLEPDLKTYLPSFVQHWALATKNDNQEAAHSREWY